MSRLLYISNLGKQIQYIEKAVATYPELLQGEVDLCNMKKPPQWDADFESRLRAADVVLAHYGRHERAKRRERTNCALNEAHRRHDAGSKAQFWRNAF